MTLLTPLPTACCLLPALSGWWCFTWDRARPPSRGRHAARVVLVGSGRDAALARQITQGNPWPGAADCTGQLSLRETAALIESANLFIGPDSGPAHLAAAVGTPAVVLFSGTNRVRQWRPWGRNILTIKHQVPCSPCHRTRCPVPGHPCLALLTPAAVMGRVRALWSGDGFGHAITADGTLRVMKSPHAPA